MAAVGTPGRTSRPERLDRSLGVQDQASPARGTDPATTSERLAREPSTVETLGAAPSPLSALLKGSGAPAVVLADAPAAQERGTDRRAQAEATASEAADDIRDNLEDGIFTEVSRGDLLENGEILTELSTLETRALIDELDDGELAKWFGEFHDGGLPFREDGLDATERAAVYDTLAARLTPEQLVRVYDALDGESRKLEFADAIGRETASFDKVDFIRRIADRVDDDPRQIDAGALGTTTRYWDTDARVVATLLGSFGEGQPAGLTVALDSLSESELDAVLSAAVGQTSYSSHFNLGGPVLPALSSSPGLLIDIVEDAAAAVSDPNVKAKLFELAAPKIDDIRGDPGLFSPPRLGAGEEAGAVADALTALLDSDTVGIVTALESEGAADNSRAGNGLSAYVEELIRQDDTDTLSEILVRLQTGNDGTRDVIDFLTESDGRIGTAENYQNAANLGYFVGAIREGIEAVNAGTEADAALLKTVFGTALGTIGGGGPGKVVGGALVKEFVDEITSGIVSGRLELADGLEALAWPDINNTTIESAFDDAVDRVQRN